MISLQQCCDDVAVFYKVEETFMVYLNYHKSLFCFNYS